MIDPMTHKAPSIFSVLAHLTKRGKIVIGGKAVKLIPASSLHLLSIVRSQKLSFQLKIVRRVCKNSIHGTSRKDSHVDAVPSRIRLTLNCCLLDMLRIPFASLKVKNYLESMA